MSTLTVLAFIMVPACAKAEEAGHVGSPSTAALYQLCTSSSDIDYGMCAGYVTALADLLMSESVAGYKACNFETVRTQEIMDIVRNYIAANQGMNSRPARIVAAAALAKAFPCP